MRRFRFQLEALLQSRMQTEHRRQEALAEVNRQRAALEDSLRMRQATIATGRNQLRRQLTGLLSMDDLRLHAAAGLQLIREAQRTVLELAGVHKRHERAQSDLVEARRRRRAIELLRERRLEQWKLQADREETEMLDELAVSLAARKSESPSWSVPS